MERNLIMSVAQLTEQLDLHGLVTSLWSLTRFGHFENIFRIDQLLVSVQFENRSSPVVIFFDFVPKGRLDLSLCHIAGVPMKQAWMKMLVMMADAAAGVAMVIFSYFLVDRSMSELIVLSDAVESACKEKELYINANDEKKRG